MKRITFIMLFFYSSILLTACGNNDHAVSDSGLGGITATAVWPGGSAPAKSGTVMHKAPSEVAWVRMIVSKGATTLTADFASSAGSGSISGVPAGTGWTLTFAGLNAAKTIVYYEGSKGGISVTGGQTTNAGSVTMRVMPGISGMLDTTFDGDGMVITTIGVNNSCASSIVQQTDGKLVVAGHSNFQFAVVRYNTDGSLDTSFGGGGIATFVTGSNGVAEAMVIQPDNKIIVAGRAGNINGLDTVLVRILPDGSPDTSFGVSGLVTRNVATQDAANAIGLQSDGTIITAGYAGTTNKDFALLRFDSSGGVISTTTTAVGAGEDIAYALAIATDNSIYVAGDSFNGTNNDFALVKYDATGTFVSKTTISIGTGNDQARSIAIQPDGKILVGGSTDCATGVCFGLVRYNSVGVLDPTFGTGGKLSLSFYNYPNYSADAMRVQPDGKILIAGLVNNATRWVFGVIRLNADGTLDQTFSPVSGPYVVLTSIGVGIDMNRNLSHLGMLVQSDGKIVFAANAAATGGAIQGYALARYWNDVTTKGRIYGVENSQFGVYSTWNSSLTQTIPYLYTVQTPSNIAFTLSGISVDAAANRLYTRGSGTGGHLVYVIDTINNMTIAEIVVTTPSANAGGGVAAYSGTNRVYANNNDGGAGTTVAVIDTTSNTMIGGIPGFNGPSGMALDAVANLLYVSNTIGNTVSVVDTVTNTIINTLTGFSGPISLTFDDTTGKLFVVNGANNTVTAVTLATGARSTMTVGTNPTRSSFDSAAQRLYVANYGNGSGTSVSVINTATNQVIDTITTPTGPRSVRIDSTAKKLYIDCEGDQTIHVYDVTSGGKTQVGTMAGGWANIFVVP